MQTAALGGYVHAGMHEMVEEYQAKFGLNRPLWPQYLTYLADMSRFDFSYSIASFPRRVVDMIWECLPWTIALLAVTTAIAFVIGTLLGALLAWPGAPGWLQYVMPPLMALTAVPFFLLGLMLIYVFGFTLQWLPLFGGYTAGTIPRGPRLRHRRARARDPAGAVDHPGLARLLGARHARDDGHHPRRGLRHLCRGQGAAGPHHLLPLRVRNALLPQATALALVLGQLVSGAVLVEMIFRYPGIGTVLYQAILATDFFVVQGIIFVLIVSIGLTTLILDLVYPLLDPRITFGESAAMPWRETRPSPPTGARRRSRSGGRTSAIYAATSLGRPPAPVGLVPFVVIGIWPVDPPRPAASARLLSRPPGSCPSAATSKGRIFTR